MHRPWSGTVSLLLLAATASLAPACGSTAPAPEDVPPAKIPRVLAAAVCDATRDCLGAELDISLGGADCVATTAERASAGPLSLLPGAVASHRVAYDSTRVQACTEAIRAAGCDFATRRLSSLCDFAHGTVARDGDCTLDAECTPGLYCKANASCPGSCAALVSEGGDCTQSDDCEDGLACLPSTGKCTKPATSGAACGGASRTPCGPGLVCRDATTTTAGRCAVIRDAFTGKAGDACDLGRTVLCQEGLSCAVTGVNDAGTSLLMVCERPGKGPACRYALPSECPAGQFCETIDATGTDGACKPYPADGEPCVSRSPTDPNSTIDLCAPDATCLAGTCTKPRRTGAPCATAGECLSGACVVGACAPTACGP